MNLLDWVMLGWLIIAFISGARLGLVYRLGHILGLVAGIYLAVEYYELVAGWVGNSVTANIFAFIILFVGIAELAGLVALVLDKFFHVLSWIPFLKTANVLLGGLLGLATHVVIVSLIVYICTTQMSSAVFTQTVNESTLGPLAQTVGSGLAVFLPFI